MKKLHVVIAFVILVFASSCEKEATPPQLAVSKTEINLSYEKQSDYFIVSNPGDLQLIWELIADSEIVFFADGRGSALNDQDTVNVKIDPLIVPGEYSEIAKIKSNGGEAVITINISIPERVGIIPGEGTYNIPVYSSFRTIKEIYGTSSRIFYNYIDDLGLFLTEVDYFENGAGFLFLTQNGSIQPDDQAFSIILFPPYPELTKENIGVYSSPKEVVSAYGPPEEEANFLHLGNEILVYHYPTKGMSYTYYADYAWEVIYMEIYEAYTPGVNSGKRNDTGYPIKKLFPYILNNSTKDNRGN